MSKIIWTPSGRITSSFDDLRKLLSDEDTAYGMRALDEEYKCLAETPRGGRNYALNRAACKLGSLIAGNQLTEDTVNHALISACRANGLDTDDGGMDGVRKTIRSGLSKGKQNPRYPADNEKPKPRPAPPRGSLNLRKASNIKPERVSWLWDGVLAKGSLSLLAGNPGLGKSQASLSIAAAISSGGCWPASKQRAELGNVIVASMEDRAEDTIVPRLKACGADLERVQILTTVIGNNGEERQFNLETDIPLLNQAIDQMGSVALIIIDPITAYLGKSDANNSGEVRRITTELTALAHDHNCCVLMVSHLNKKSDQQAAFRVLGSVSWVGAARTAFMIDRDSEDSERRIMAPTKNNLAVDSTSFAFTVQTKELQNGIKTSCVVWEDASHSNTADRMMADKGDGGDALNEAIGFCTELLKNGPVLSKLANKAANDNHISESTLKRAKRKLGIEGTSNDGGVTWYWEYEKKAC